MKHIKQTDVQYIRDLQTRRRQILFLLSVKTSPNGLDVAKGLKSQLAQIDYLLMRSV